MSTFATRPARVLARLLGALVAVATVGGVFAWMFVRGSFGVDDWVVRQVTAIAQTYVVPTMTFESFDYQSPRTVELTGVRFTAPDGTRVLDAGLLTLTLAEIPRRGRPIVIERVAVDGGVLRLERAPEVDGVLFKGLVPFVKRNNITNQERVEESVRLSNVLRLEEVRLNNAGVAYIAAPGEAPMRISGIDLDMDVVESTPGDDGGVWHTIRGVVERGRLLTLDLNGRANLDTATVVFENTSLEGNLDGEIAALLPPEIQSIVREHEAAGRLRLDVNGRLAAGAPAASDLAAVATLEGLNFVVEQFRFEVDEGRIDAALREGVAHIEPLAFQMYDGRLEATGSWPLPGVDGPARVVWDAGGVQLEQMLRAGMGNPERPTLAGVFASIGNASAQPADPRATISGDGNVSIRQGRLAIVPFIDQLIERLSVMTTGGAPPTQRFDVDFRIAPEWVHIDEFDLQTDVFAAVGRGSVGYDGSLDLVFTGGPLKRVGRGLGVLGDILSSITERAVSYRVRGQIGESKVSVQPLGIGGALDR